MNISIKSSLRTFALLFSLLFISSAVASLNLSLPANAANKKDWIAGNIISDANFTKKDSMSTSEIQAFLNKQIGTCDVQGTGKAVEYGSNLTRAEYAKSRGWAGPPYVCLNKYYEVPKTKPGSGTPKNNWNKNLTKPSDSKSAAWIIKDAANRYNISPKVLLVKIATESAGPLTSDKWPLYSQYKYAMGSHCPDSGPGGSANCDSKYAGFSIQMYSAAELMRWYLDSMQESWWTYKKPYKNNDILWNIVESGCGSGKVYIQNKATAALYTYTPYQPNSAALNNMYGTGNGCSAYGNRNFWRVYTDWFGSSRGDIPLAYGINITSPISITPPDSQGRSTVSFKVKNVVSTKITFDKTVVQCRNYQGGNCDSNYGGGWYVDPGQERTFSYTFNISSANTYRIVPYLMIGGIWYKYDTSSDGVNSTTLQRPDIKITSSINLSSGNLPPRTKTTVSFNLKNTGNSPIYMSKTVVQCRYQGKNCDSNYGGPITVSIGEAKTFNYQFTSMGGGDHILIPYFMVDGVWYQFNPSGNNTPTRTVNVADLRLVNSGVTINKTSPFTGETITATFTATNDGTKPITASRIIIQCRLNSKIRTNCDPGYEYNDTINPGQQKTYSATFRPQEESTYTFTPYFEYMGQWGKYNKGETPENSLSVPIAKYTADMRLTSNITTSPTKPKPGDNVTVTYSVRNFGSKPAYYQRSVLQCRKDIKPTNCDPAYQSADIIIQPNESRTFNATFHNIQPGNYRFTPYFEQNNEWNLYSKGTAPANTHDIFVNPITITSPITFTPSTGTTSKVSFSVKNFGDSKVTFDKTVVQCRNLQNKNCDSNYGGGWYLDAGQERAFSYTIDVSKVNTYKIIPYYYKDNAWHRYGTAGSNQNERTLVIN